MNIDRQNRALAIIVLVLAGIVGLAYVTRGAPVPAAVSAAGQQMVDIPISWGDLGKKLTALGVIDEPKFDALYAKRPDLKPQVLLLVHGTASGDLVVTPDNAGLVLNLLWAFGLANTNRVLEDTTQMENPAYGAGGFASTGGWSLSTGDSMAHYDAHALVTLTGRQQALVERVAAGIYRPCCDNPTHFPDCNHGMAMLGLLELMAKNGIGEEDMYRYALRVQALWFPQQYAIIEQYLGTHGSSLATADPKEILGEKYSSASGFAAIQAQVDPQGGNSAQCSA